MNEVNPPKRQAANVLRSFIAHSAQEQVEPESKVRTINIEMTSENTTQEDISGRAVSPVSKHHGVLQTLCACLMEPLLTPKTLQHLQVPPARTQTL